MHIQIGDVKLFFDVEGAGLVTDGPAMRQKPTLILIHGGPGADHSLYKPLFGDLSDIAQVIYLDLRGNGRSDDGDPDDWTLAQWGDDIRAFCEALNIERPIVYGASFGGVVAQSYATRHPDHAGGLILAATAARQDFETIYQAFDRLGGTEAGRVARQYWNSPSPESRAEYFNTCLPLYSVNPPDPDVMQRMIIKNPVAMAFNGPKNEQGRFDFHGKLASLTMPVLILSGDKDVIMPQVFSDEIETSLTSAPVRHVRLADCGHMQGRDQPKQMLGDIREFIAAFAGNACKQ